jgi:hypothetical protein
MDRLLTVLALFSVTVIVLVLASVRRAHIRVEYSVSWLTAAVLLLIVSLNPDFIRWLATHIGVEYPPLAVLMVMFGIFLVVIYRLSLRVSALKDASIALAQRVAILEYQLKSAHEERETPQNG